MGHYSHNSTKIGIVLLAITLRGCGKQDDPRAKDELPPNPRRQEVLSVFAELHMRQEAHRLEHGSFVSTGSSEQDRWPSVAADGAPRPVQPLPATWVELGFKPPFEDAVCGYVAIAGDASATSRIGPKAAELGFAAPARSWYYLLAECNLDGDPAVNSWFLTSSQNSTVTEQNNGR